MSIHRGLKYHKASGRCWEFTDNDPLGHAWAGDLTHHETPAIGMMLIVDEAIADNIDQNLCYVDVSGTPTIELRPEPVYVIDTTTITADGVDKAVISSIPSGAKITITDESGTTEIVADGTDLEITSPEPDTIKVTILLFPALDYVVQVEAE